MQPALIENHKHVNASALKKTANAELGLPQQDIVDAYYEANQIPLQNDRVVKKSDRAPKPQRRKPGRKPRETKKVIRKEDDVEESDNGPREPVSERPKRSRASGINYNLLVNTTDHDSEISDAKLRRRRRIRQSSDSSVKPNGDMEMVNGTAIYSPRKARNQASQDPAEKTISSLQADAPFKITTPKRPRGRKPAQETEAPTEFPDQNGRDGQEPVNKIRKKRRRRIDAHLDQDYMDGQVEFEPEEPVQPKKRRRLQKDPHPPLALGGPDQVEVDNVKDKIKERADSTDDAKRTIEEPKRKRRYKKPVCFECSFM